jgi:hypothetical protein
LREVVPVKVFEEHILRAVFENSDRRGCRGFVALGFELDAAIGADVNADGGGIGFKRGVVVGGHVASPLAHYNLYNIRLVLARPEFRPR